MSLAKLEADHVGRRLAHRPNVATSGTVAQPPGCEIVCSLYGLAEDRSGGNKWGKRPRSPGTRPLGKLPRQPGGMYYPRDRGRPGAGVSAYAGARDQGVLTGRKSWRSVDGFMLIGICRDYYMGKLIAKDRKAVWVGMPSSRVSSFLELMTFDQSLKAWVILDIRQGRILA